MRLCHVPIATAEFQSTLPARGSDSCHLAVLDFIYEISIHAPRKGERQAANLKGLKA